jgi:hypothetical protein
MTLIRLLCAAAAMVSFMCGSTGPNAGSETTSGVKIASLGDTLCVTTAPGTTLMIFDARYSPGDTLRYADTAVVGDSGQVSFTGLPAGLYNIFAYPNLSNTGAAVLGIPINANNSDSTISDSAQYSLLKSVTGTVSRQGQPDSLADVFFVGSLFYAKTDYQGKYRIDKVPPGSYKAIARHLALWRPAGFDTVKVDIVPNDTPLDITVNLTTQ